MRYQYLTHIVLPGQYKDGFLPVTGQGGNSVGQPGRSLPSIAGGRDTAERKRSAEVNPLGATVPPPTSGQNEEGGTECTEVVCIVLKHTLITIRLDHLPSLMSHMVENVMVDARVFGRDTAEVDMLLYHLLERIQTSWIRPVKIMSSKINLVETEVRLPCGVRAAIFRPSVMSPCVPSTASPMVNSRSPPRANRTQQRLRSGGRESLAARLPGGASAGCRSTRVRAGVSSKRSAGFAARARSSALA